MNVAVPSRQNISSLASILFWCQIVVSSKKLNIENPVPLYYKPVCHEQILYESVGSVSAMLCKEPSQSSLKRNLIFLL